MVLLVFDGWLGMLFCVGWYYIVRFIVVICGFCGSIVSELCLVGVGLLFRGFLVLVHV